LSIDGKKLDDATFQKYRQQVAAKAGNSLQKILDLLLRVKF
jgi:hypothetical protein